MDKKQDRVLKYFIYVFWIFLSILFIKDLFTFPPRSIVWFISLIVLIIVYLKFGRRFLHYYSLILIIVLLNIFGEVIFGFFYNTSFYDKILHFINPLLICFFIYNISKNKFQNKKLLILFCMAVAVSLSSLWEIFEYLIDTYLNGYMQGVYLFKGQDFFGLAKRQVLDKLEDTIIDLTLGVLGVIVFGFIKYFQNKKWFLKKIKKGAKMRQ